CRAVAAGAGPHGAEPERDARDQRTHDVLVAGLPVRGYAYLAGAAPDPQDRHGCVALTGLFAGAGAGGGPAPADLGSIARVALDVVAPSTRLFGICARDAERVVILRRGPSKQVLLLTWDT